MHADTRTHLLGVDRALRQLCHLFEPPADITDAGTRIEASTLLVLEAVLDGGAGTVRDVARELDVAHSTASRLVTRAERAGTVCRRPSPTNGRETRVTATELGVALRERGVGFRLARLTALTDGWPAEDVETLARLLGRFATTAVARTDARPAGP